MCIEFCAINTNKKLELFYLPGIAYLIDKPGKAKCFTSIDLATAYQ